MFLPYRTHGAFDCGCNYNDARCQGSPCTNNSDTFYVDDNTRAYRADDGTIYTVCPVFDTFQVKIGSGPSLREAVEKTIIRPMDPAYKMGDGHLLRQIYRKVGDLVEVEW